MKRRMIDVPNLTDKEWEEYRIMCIKASLGYGDVASGLIKEFIKGGKKCVSKK